MTVCVCVSNDVLMHCFHRHCSPFAPFSHSAHWMHSSCRSTSRAPFWYPCLSNQIPSSSSFCRAASLSIHAEWIFTRLVLNKDQTMSRWAHSHPRRNDGCTVWGRGLGDPLVIYYFHSIENNCLKQTESLWTIGWVYLTNLHGCSPLWTHILMERRGMIWLALQQFWHWKLSVLTHAQNCKKNCLVRYSNHSSVNNKDIRKPQCLLYRVYFHVSIWFFSRNIKVSSITFHTGAHITSRMEKIK